MPPFVQESDDAQPTAKDDRVQGGNKAAGAAITSRAASKNELWRINSIGGGEGAIEGPKFLLPLGDGPAPRFGPFERPDRAENGGLVLPIGVQAFNDGLWVSIAHISRRPEI
jgi:hypothetical protein